MLNNLKALLIVLPVAVVMFAVAKPVCIRFMSESDFIRRRNVWFALTLTAFISPSFWLFVLVAVPLLAWSARKESNVTALYLLLLLALPPLGMEIPVAFISKLFDLNYYRILSLAVLLPAAWRVWKANDKSGRPTTGLTDCLLIAYAVLQLVLLVPYESITNSMRRSFLFAIDSLVIYYVASRSCTSRPAITEAMACFCLSCALLVPIAVFESAKGWLLYVGIGEAWGNAIDFAYAFRSDTLRAQASAGHSLAFGYVLAMTFGFALYLRTRLTVRSVGLLLPIWLWVGLLAAYSRAPWLVAVLVFFTYVALGPHGTRRFIVSAVAAALLGAAAVMSPIGDRIIDNLPFVGTVDEENVAYRQRLAEMSWELIKQNPVFGDPNVLFHLESLRQGQGIIDLVNTYATIAMYYGITGLLLFVGFFVSGAYRAYKVARTSADADGSLLGGSLIACMLGTLFMMATGSFGTSLAVMFWLLPGIAVGYAQTTNVEARTPARTSGTPKQPMKDSRGFA